MLGVGFGVDEVGEALGLGEVELAGQEGAAGEFAGLGEAQAGDGAKGFEQQARHGAAAMGMEFQHILAGEGMGAGEEEGEGLVERGALRRTVGSARGSGGGRMRGCGISGAAAEGRGHRERHQRGQPRRKRLCHTQ